MLRPTEVVVEWKEHFIVMCDLNCKVLLAFIGRHVCFPCNSVFLEEAASPAGAATAGANTTPAKGEK